MSGELLRVEGLVKRFRVTRGAVLRRVAGYVRAVDDVSFSLREGETLGLVGESGCGKSTVARSVLRLVEPTAGRVVFAGRDISHSRQRELRFVRRHMQMVFQDPDGALDPRMTVEDIVAEPLRFHGLAKGSRSVARRVAELLTQVGLGAEHARRYPHECSGGQRQRVGVARALATRPQLLVLDEPVSALDVSIQAQILNLLEDLQRELGLSYLFIAHDLSLVRHICGRVAVMHLGQIVETAGTERLFAAAHHPYTQALLSAVPTPDPDVERERRRLPLASEVPSAVEPPSGCRFRTRCFKAQPVCAEREPSLEPVHGPGHQAACFFAEPRDTPLSASGDSQVRSSG